MALKTLVNPYRSEGDEALIEAKWLATAKTCRAVAILFESIELKFDFAMVTSPLLFI